MDGPASVILRRQYHVSNERNIFVRYRIMGAGLALMALACGAARGEQVAARWTGYLRAGPGLQFAVLDEIPPDYALAVHHCDAGWCLVTYGRAEGYVAQADLRGPGAAPAARGTRQCFDTVLSGYGAGSPVRFCGR